MVKETYNIDNRLSIFRDVERGLGLTSRSERNIVGPMVNELEVLKIVAERLESSGIPYMVTGSMANNFYAMPRMTRDIDIVIQIGESDVEKVVALFSPDFYADGNQIMNAVKSRRMFNIIHNEGVVKVDFIVRKDAEYRRIEFERRKEITFEGTRLFVTSPEDLIISKLFWAKDTMSEMQLRDVSNLLKSVKDLDMTYINKWVSALELTEVYEKAVK